MTVILAQLCTSLSTIVTTVGQPHCRQLQARIYFCKPHPYPSIRRVSPAVVALATVSPFPLPRTRQGRRGPDAEARASGARDGSGEGSFHSPLPLPETPAFSFQAEAFNWVTTRVTSRSANHDAAPQVRPAPWRSSGSFPLTPESLPKREPP